MNFFLRFSLLFSTLFLMPCAYAQENVEIMQADEFSYLNKDGKKIAKFKGNVAFRQGNVILRCDSALKYEESNMVEASGSIHITQGDTLNLTGKKVLYDGRTKKARVTGGVVLSDREMTLNTEELDYDTKTKVAYYSNGGSIINKSNRLTSVTGSYNGFNKELYFRKNVELSNPEYTMYSDTLRYNTSTRTAYFYGPTTIRSQDNTIYCEYGWYDTQNERSQFSKRASLVSKENILKADSMLYNRRSGLGRAFGNISVFDSVERMQINGSYGEYDRLKHSALITKRCLASKMIDNDTLYLSADTFYYRFDTLDDTRHISAFKRVKIFKSDLQGSCDSLYYSSADSLFFMFVDPVLWTEANQLTGDTIRVDIKQNRVNFIDMYENAFIASQEDSIRFNQIRGKTMRGIFAEGNVLYKVNVNGNGQSIYYAREDSAYSGVNVISCSDMVIRVDSNKVKDITFITEPEGVFYPPQDFNKAQNRLKGFLWLSQRRPRSLDDLRR